MEQKIGRRKIILSGIQPSGKLHLGNLIGAIRNWVRLQDEYQCYFAIVDMHAITVPTEPSKLKVQTLDLAAMLIACGIDPNKSVLFIQSHVPEHAQLAWVLNCYTSMGELNRMTQFKDKSAKQKDFINVGLFTYPVLQAADILLYQADLVPVGEDQKQHLELSRNIAERFNYYFPDTFNLPEPMIPEVGARIMSLQDPTKKMSKSDENEKSIIYISDSENEIKNKIKRAVTDSGANVKYTDKKPGIKNLIAIYHIATGLSIPEIEQKFANKGYGEFKVAVAEALVEYLTPIRNKYLELKSNQKELKSILASGADAARKVANKTLRKVYKKIGFIVE